MDEEIKQQNPEVPGVAATMVADTEVAQEALPVASPLVLAASPRPRAPRRAKQVNLKPIVIHTDAKKKTKAHAEN